MKKVVLLLVVMLVSIMAASVVYANGGEISAQVTRGNFETFAAGIGRGYEINGNARMVRAPSGKTLVSLTVSGLVPETTYPAHVHNKACQDANGGGHYQQIVSGPVDNVNEIWPGFTTNALGIGQGKAVNDFWARPEAQSVVIHDTDGARIACADLE